ncbi:MAG: methylenetetrahydrofolate reductase C-terminal domain-containing protein [Caldimicrobium sp.]
MSIEFRELIKKEGFLFTFELVPGRSVRTREYQEILRFLQESVKERVFQVFSITDNAGGHPALSPIPLGKTIKDLGLEAIIHFSCKDKNRNQIESELLALDREGLHNLLVLTGDYPFYGYMGKAKPVFDLDSVLLLKLITDMERGIELPKEAPGGGKALPGIPFFKGAVVNPFKLTYEELFWQYFKLYLKLKAGAYFIISQVGFYPKTWRELKIVLDKGLTQILSELLEEPIDWLETMPEKEKSFKDIPLLGSILYLTPSLINLVKKGKIPGILITESILRALEKSSNFEKKNLEILAKFASLLKALGYKGVHLCGFPLNYGKINQFLELFYKYENQGENFAEEFENKVLLELNNGQIKGAFPSFLTKEHIFKKRFSLAYYINHAIHSLFFNTSSKFYPLLKKILLRIDQSPFFRKYFTRFEYFIKKILFSCQECGDCTLFEYNYHCPQSGCAKYLLNGPCGGSIAGFCEVYPYIKECHFVKALKSPSTKKNIIKFFYLFRRGYLSPRDWELYKSSSWLNFYLKRDHHKYEDGDS